MALCQAEHLGCHHLKSPPIAALGVDLEQFVVDGHPGRGAPHRFFEDFLGLQIATIGEVHICFGHWIDIACSVQLAGRVHHRRAGRDGFCRVDALSAAGAEERVGLQAAFKEGTVHAPTAFALAHPVNTKSSQQGEQNARQRKDQRVVSQLVDERRFVGQRRRCWPWCRLRGGWRYGWGRRCSGCFGGRRGSRCDGRCWLCSWCRCCSCRTGCWSSGCAWQGCGWRCRRCSRCSSPGWCRGAGCGCPEFGEFFNVARQLSHARGSFLGLTLLRNLFFACGLRWRGSFGERELVGRRRCRGSVLHLGLHTSCGLAVGDTHLCLRCCTGQAPSEIVEIPALGRDGLASFTGADGARLLGGREIDDGAGFDPVDVAANKSVWARAKHGHEHLVQRNVGRFVGCCNAACGIAGLNTHLPARCGP